MTPKERLLALKKLLSREPSELLRRKVDYLLNNWPDDPSKKLAHKTADKTLDTWPPFRWTRFQGVQGETALLSPVYFEGLVSGKGFLTGLPQIVKCKRIFIPELVSDWNLGYVPYPGDEVFKWAKGKPKIAYATIVVNWPVNTKGELDDSNILNFKVQPLVLNVKQFLAFKEIYTLFGFEDSSIEVECLDTTYQDLTFGRIPESILKHPAIQTPEVLDRLEEEIRFVLKDLKTLLAYPYGLKQLKEILP
ncbi:MAG: hypothetical protein OEY01_03860 [Desulfobulbaceae bacterium]|nr:hypothetical protein [Desulfobulbaceae bacterium]